MTSQADMKLQIIELERQCESQMAEFERTFNYSYSQEVLRNILVQIESIQSLSAEKEEADLAQEAEYKMLQKLQARVYECIGSIYLSLSLPNQSLSVLERASNIMLQVQGQQNENMQDDIDMSNSLFEKRLDKVIDMKDQKIIARILIKTSFALFLLSEQKSSYRLLRDAHTFLKQNNLLDTEEEALLFFNFGNYYRFIYQDELSETCYLRCISIREKIFGKNSPMVFEAKQELAKLYIESGQLSQAEQLIEEVLRYKIHQYGEQSPSTSVGYLYRATLLFVTSSNVDDALQDVLRSIQINTLYIGEYNKINAECYILLGRILAKKLPVATDSFKNTYYSWNSKQQFTPFSWAQYKSTTIPDPQSSPSSSSSSSKSSSQQSSSNTLTSPEFQSSNYLNLQQLKFNKYPLLQENNIANLYSESQADLLLKYSQIYRGEETELYQVYFNKALSILKTLFGEQNGCVGIAYNAIGKVLLSLKQYERALNCFNAAIEIYQCQSNNNSLNQFATDNSDDFNLRKYFAIKNAADCNMKLGRLKTAHSLYQQILQYKDIINSTIYSQHGSFQSQKSQQEQLPFTLSFTSTTQSIILNNTNSLPSTITIEDEHKKLFVSPIDINPDKIMKLLNQSRTED